MEFILRTGQLKYNDILLLLDETNTLRLDSSCQQQINKSEQFIAKTVSKNKTVYGVNTGFGALANVRINKQDLTTLQHSLVLSHAAGTGELLDDKVVRLILALKINSLARGYSGVRHETINALIKIFNAQIYPCIPEQGSVGASGDLAPLAHLSAVLLGVGKVRYKNTVILATSALKNLHLSPLQLAPKEGLALLNGTQVSTALALIALIRAENIFFSAITAGALSVDAARGSDVPFDARIQELRGLTGQIKVAKMLRELLRGSKIRQSHLVCQKVQDPYSLRCQPQVMGACYDQLQYAAHILLTEANAVSDNPLVFAEDGAILSGGNFHAQPVAFAADAIAIALAEIGSLSERRIALLIDPNFSNLPPFLVPNAGINSGFMIPQVTAAALQSENKSLAHPVSIDSLPTSANQEDHVSMATYAARRLLRMCDNLEAIIAIEQLAACQAFDLLRPLTSSPPLEHIYNVMREKVPFYDRDRFMATDLANAELLVRAGKLRAEALKRFSFLSPAAKSKTVEI